MQNKSRVEYHTAFVCHCEGGDGTWYNACHCEGGDGTWNNACHCEGGDTARGNPPPYFCIFLLYCGNLTAEGSP